MSRARKLSGAVYGIALLLPLFALAQTTPFNMQGCLTARGASSPPSLQDLQACTPKPSTTQTPATITAPSGSMASASCPNLARTLQKASRGTDVTQLQNFLIARGDLSAENNTGYFGALTEAAVQKFQCSQSVVCSGNPSSTGYGLVGAKTRAAIQRVCGGTASTPTTGSSSGGSMMDTLNAQIKLLQERIAALKSGSLASTQTTTQSTQTTTQTTTGNTSCTFNSQTVPHGSSVTAYQSSSVAAGQSCQSQTRSCSNGSLSGTYTNSSCTVQAAQNTTNASCTLNGQTYAHGQSANFYNVSSVFSQSNPTKCPTPITRSCSNGTLSGNSSYVHATCEDYTKFQKLTHGELTVTSAKNIGTVTAYFSASPCTTYRIDWGDGLSTIKEATASYTSCSQSSVTTYQENHTYQWSGDYTVSIARVEDAYSTHWYVPKKSVVTTTAINSATHDGCYVTTASDGTTSSTGCSGTSSTSSTSQATESTGSCRMPRKYTFTLSSDVNLSCDSSFNGRAVIFNPTINDEGFAIARATLKIRNNYSGPGGWSVQAYIAGGGGLNYDMADNIAPGDTKWKTVLGSGNILSGYNTVRVFGYNYGVNGTCSNGGFSVLAGSTLEVWVEDPAAQCKGKYVGLTSIYESGGEGVWGNDFPTIAVPATSDATSILIMSSIEGTLEYCTSGTLSAITSTNYHSLLGSTVSDTVANQGLSSGALCHLSLATSNTASYSSSVTQAWLHPRNQTNASVYSGYRSGGSYSGSAYGEAAIGFVKMQ